MGGYVINTNISAMNAQTNSNFVSRNLSNSLEKLSSGLRINKAADDSSGLAIADSLRSQANSLGQAIRNANDGIGLIKIADKSIDEQVKILDTIKVKATAAAQDTQSRSSRTALQADITRLIEQVDNIAFQTSYNGIKLLAGSFTNKEFQVGAYSHETIRASIGATSSDKIGSVRKETSAVLTAAGTSTLTFKNPSGGQDIQLESVVISTGARTGIGKLAEVINKNSDELGVRASAKVQTTGSTSITAGNIGKLYINGTEIGDVDSVEDNDRSGVLVSAINKFTADTGVLASVDTEGRLNLSSVDGRGIRISAGGVASAVMNIGSVSASADENYGRLTLTSLQSNDIRFSDAGIMNTVINSNGASTSVNLRDVVGNFTASDALAAGAFTNTTLSAANGASNVGAGVVSKIGANIVMDIAQSAINQLDRVRADIGAVQNQLEVSINATSVTQVNVKAAEANIRDVDFGSESANFSKNNILAQSGAYALSQANAVQQNVLRLLQ